MNRPRLPIETLDLEFINAMMEIGKLGQLHHGEHHYQDIEDRPKDRNILVHLADHYTSYRLKEPHDLGDTSYHLAAVAFNAMMEYYWYVRGK